jgi:hypothetical protein
VSKTDDALWICRVENIHSITGYCDVVVPQPHLEKHLWSDHRMREADPVKVIGWFLLARGSHHGKPPALGKADDQTEPMFGRDEFS